MLAYGTDEGKVGIQNIMSNKLVIYFHGIN